MEANHSNQQQIGMSFFSKLSLPHYRPARIMTCVAKAFDFNFTIENGGADRDESPLARLARKGSVEIFDHRNMSEMARFSTPISAHAQLEAIMSEPEFLKPIQSPRGNYCFLSLNIGL